MSTAESSPRIVFLDVDGTILDHGRSVADSTVAAIRGAREAGHLVLLCTGRSAVDIHPDVAAIGFDGAITNSGGRAVVGDELVASHPMPRAAASRLMRYFDEHAISYFLQTDDGVYAGADVQHLVAELAERWRGEADAIAAPRFRDLAEAPLDAVSKAVFLSDRTGTVDQVQDDLGGAFHVVPGSMPLPGGSNGEVGMRGVTKGAAILEVLAHLGAPASASIGIGDSWNDVEMFEVCGVGIAMGNAEPELQERADEVTTAVSHDGVWHAFVRHGLIAG